MEAAVLLWFHLLLSVIFCNGFHVQGPSGSLTVQLGDSVMLPCFVETPLPMEDLEVEWKRNDSGSLVHLWQNGESRPESQNQHYHERAHFFSEEVAHGNFSLLLTNVTQKDAGVYTCVVYTNQHSDETLIEIMETERLIVSGGHVISAYVGEEITLNCSVDSHIPSEKIEEVSWKKQDEDLLVLLYQQGEILTESTHDRFKGRVEFFSAEDRNKGNFSMRLKDVRIEDKGLYICLAFSGTLSDNTTVEVQQLDNSRRARVIQCAHVLYPNIMMSIVFILWGVTEGLFTEAATCSALNLVRILSLFWITDHMKLFQDIVVDFWNKTNTEGKAFISTLYLFLILLHAFNADFFLFVSIMMILEIVSVSGSIYIHYDVVTDVNERGALTWVTVFLYILTMMTMFLNLKRLAAVWSVVVFMIGSVLVVFVNVAALLVELILKAHTLLSQITPAITLLHPLHPACTLFFTSLTHSPSLCTVDPRLRKDIKSLRECRGCKQKQKTCSSYNEHVNISAGSWSSVRRWFGVTYLGSQQILCDALSDVLLGNFRSWCTLKNIQDLL
ncbi:hypothetical protein C0J50_20756 [Silurus asotus]|uniref:Ig-like domain-containing protein n=1 Tax=Silurus asotus TaxID=30991 RepID=A0AAD5AQF1_SILAS|nr:hypothetical protein C0J50_20756 [Silurus asotus]